MEVFSLLKYWRTSAGNTTPTPSTTTPTTTTTTTTIRHVADETSDEEDGDDDGPFFDLEFTLPAEEEDVEQECDVSSDESEAEVEVEEEDCEEEDELDFTVDSSGSTGNRTDPDPNLSFSPSDDLFFNGRFVPLEPTELGESQPKTQFPSSLLKPATKLRVLMLGFKKPKSTEKVVVAEAKQQQQQQESKSSFTVKLKVEEVPIVSLFTRDNSSRNSNKVKQQEEVIGSEEKKFAKDVLQKYLNMVKPLYFKVSRRNGGEKSTGFSGHLSLSSTTPISSPKIDGEIKEVEANVKNQKEGNMNLNLTAGLRNVRKHLGKSRSASAAVAAVNSSATGGGVQSRRHDDSLLQQQDGIQSAILHCKRSFTASRDSDSSALFRCTSDPSHEKSQPKLKSVNCSSSSRSSLDETRVKI